LKAKLIIDELAGVLPLLDVMDKNRRKTGDHHPAHLLHQAGMDLCQNEGKIIT
jgi:hypothetical protein